MTCSVAPDTADSVIQYIGERFVTLKFGLLFV